jgi:ribosomal protein S18 acetylase RimI-like enzyme
MVDSVGGADAVQILAYGGGRDFRRAEAGMTIDRATIADADEIFGLQERALAEEPGVFNRLAVLPLVLTLDELRRDFADHVVLKATVGLRIVGAVRALTRDESCYIKGPVIHPEFQQMGMGTALMQEIEAFFEEATRFEACTASTSIRSIQLYRKVGYRIFRTEPVDEEIELVFLEKCVSRSAA